LFDAVTLADVKDVQTIKVTGHLSEGSFVRNGVVQILKFDANPNPSPNPNLVLILTLCLYVLDK